VSRGLAIGDFDNDGWQDVLISNCGGPPSLLRNSGGPNSWLQLKLVGKRSNRNGIGARVELASRDRRILKEVTTGGSYLSSGDLRVHFGLGASTGPVDVTIHWPSGTTQTVEGITPRRLVVIEESNAK
jgi:hypothetical protein